MLKNAYEHKLNSAPGHIGEKIQCDIDPNDKALLMSLRPVKGTIQLVVNNLLFNICNDLRKLNVVGWRPDGDAILELLSRPRTLSPTQFDEFSERCTSISLVETVSSGIFDDRRRAEVRQTTPSNETESTDSEVSVAKRKSRNRKASAAKKDQHS